MAAGIAAALRGLDFVMADFSENGCAANLRGYLAWDETATARRPGVLVFHEGLGLGEFAMARALMLAELA